MPTFHIEAPDGRSFDVEGADMQGAVAAMKKMQGGGAAQFTAGGLKAEEPPLSPGETAKGMARSFVGGVPIAGPALEHDLPAAVSSAMGDGTFAENKAAGKEAQAKFEERFPVGSAGLGAAGGFAGTMPLIAAAPAMFGAAKAGALADPFLGGVGGAAIGGADAYMRGQDPVQGTLTGGAFGAAAPIAGKALGAMAGGVERLMGKGLPPELAGLNPKALEWAAKAAKADGLNDAQISAKFKELGPQGFLAEYGPNLREVAGYIAAHPGEGKSAVYGGIEGRKADTHGRIEDAFDSALGDRINLPRTVKEVAAQRSATARPLYERAMGHKIDYDPRLQEFVKDPMFSQAMKAGFETERLEALAEGRKFEPLRYAITGVDHAGMPIIQGVPNMRTLDMAKKGIDQLLDSPAYRDQITGRLNRSGNALNSARKAYVSHLDSINPDYAAARQSWEGPTKMLKALDNGKGSLSRNLSADEMHEEIGDMNHSEKQAYLIGLRGELARLTDASVRGDTSARDLIRSRAAQDKLTTLIGPEKAQGLQTQMEREAGFAGFEQDAIRNSKTVARGAVAEMMTPNPEDTLVSRLRHKYSPHVTPFGVIPKEVEKWAVGRQEQKFEGARDALAPIVMRQGSDAERMARALIGHEPGGKISPSVERYATILLQGLTPAERQKMMSMVP